MPDTEDLVALGPDAAGLEDDTNESSSRDDTHEEDSNQPSTADYRALAELLGFGMEFDEVTRMCCGGSAWCSAEDPRCPVDEDEGPYNRTVLGAMNVVSSINRGVATFMLRAGRGFRTKVKVGRVVVNGKQRTVALKPCKGHAVPAPTGESLDGA